MSEDDRAAKAARAKAMLKKRQQKKAADPAVSTVSSLPSSRTISPPPYAGDITDIFTKDDPSDTSWLNSLPRAASPPVVTPSTVLPNDSQLHDEIVFLKSDNTSLAKRVEALTSTVRESQDLLEQERQLRSQQVSQLEAEKQQLLDNEQQTITLLVSEKASLTAQLERLEGIESNAQATESLLSEERSKSAALRDHLQRLEGEVVSVSKQNEELVGKTKEEAERSREKERELQLANATLNGFREEAESHQRRVKELEEHIQKDDRAERLERALKNAEDRADEMEFQLSKLKQAHTALKSERDELDGRLRSHRETGDEWRTKYQTLSQTHSTLQEQLASAVQEKDAFHEAKTSLQTDVNSAREEIQLLKTKLTEAASEFTSSTRNLQVLQGELKLANRRADDAERIQKDLQAEGTDLMRSLEEMRPKIVELTGIKLELGDRVAGLESALRSRDDAIAELESRVAQLQDDHARAEQEWQAKISHQDKERDLSQANSTELQDAYHNLQGELTSALSSIRTLEADRAKYHQEAARRVQDIDNLTSTSMAQMAELSALQQEVERHTHDQLEQKGFLERAQNELETLRLEISSRDAELDHLREVVSTPIQGEAPRSLDDEMLSSMKQQHALELSTLQSRIRSLETSLFDAEARGHATQKQLAALQDKTARRGLSQRSFSPASHPSRPGSRNEMHRVTSKTSNLTPRPVYDNTLSPEARHKRKISLSMLRARIESETVSRPPSRALSPLHEPSESAIHIHHRPQFLDESHVFWCHSCRGDLIVL